MKNKDHISRNEFEKLLQTFSKEDAKEHLNDFDRDALEGWQQSGIPFSRMKQLDQKMKFPKMNFSPYILGISILGLGILAFILLQSPSENDTQKKPILVKVENTDIHIPEEIDTLEVIPQKDQITVKEVKMSQMRSRNFRLKVKRKN